MEILGWIVLIGLFAKGFASTGCTIPFKAKMDANAKIIKAKCESEIQRINVKTYVDLRKVISESEKNNKNPILDYFYLCQDELNHQRIKNLNLLFNKTANYLGNEFATDTQPDQSWIEKYFDSVKDVSANELQNIWAKLLSEEILQPRTTSLRTLDLLKNISPVEAKLFTDVCGTVIRDIIIEENLKISNFKYSHILNLEDCGLVKADKINLIVQFDKGDMQSFMFYGDLELFIKTSDLTRKLVISGYKLTTSGVEIHKVINVLTKIEILKKFNEYVIDNQCELLYARKSDFSNLSDDQSFVNKNKLRPIEEILTDEESLPTTS